MKDTTYHFRGTLTIVSADNPASHLIGGYRSLSSALRKCRFCMAIDITESVCNILLFVVSITVVYIFAFQYYSEDFQSRTRITHANHCSILEANPEYFATTYGIQRDSILNESKLFHVTEGLPMDAMHDLHEGVVQYETTELLKKLISEGIITLQQVNDAILSFPYSYTDASNKPVPIENTTLTSRDHKLKQTGKISTVHACVQLLRIVLII